jgi:hypothetical protein
VEWLKVKALTLSPSTTKKKKKRKKKGEGQQCPHIPRDGWVGGPPRGLRPEHPLEVKQLVTRDHTGAVGILRRVSLEK